MNIGNCSSAVYPAVGELLNTSTCWVSDSLNQGITIAQPVLEIAKETIGDLGHYLKGVAEYLPSASQALAHTLTHLQMDWSLYTSASSRQYDLFCYPNFSNDDKFHYEPTRWTSL